MITPRVSLVAYEARQGGFIFVAVPDERGRYLRTDKSVAAVPCPHCKALVGEPCRGRNGDGYHATTHVDRRIAAKRSPAYSGAGDVIHPEDIPNTPDEYMENSS